MVDAGVVDKAEDYGVRGIIGFATGKDKVTHERRL
jgi:hypothetical protein